MTSYEQNATAFDEILVEYGKDPDPSFTEADTRAKLIDALLTRALGWPESAIRREEHVHEGYIDYTMQAGPNRMLIEAKRVGKTFVLPGGLTHNKRMTVKGLLKKQKDLSLMYDQVTRYAHERGIPFCSLTNGTQWLAFPGVRTDNILLRNSRVVAFNGLESISTNFLDFWNLFSYEAVSKGSLEHQLTDPLTRIEPSFVFNSEGRQNVPYDRNHLALAMVDILPKYFGDLHGDPAGTDMLRECFVDDVPVRRAARQFGGPDDEYPSKTLKTAGGPVLHFYSLPQVANKLDALVDVFLRGERDTYFQVLLGRVGIGKTTFLAHYFDIHRPELAGEHYILRMDFRDATDKTDLETFFQNSMWEMLAEHARFSALTARNTLRQIFKRDIDMLDRGPLKHLKQRNRDEYEDEISKHLARHLQDKPHFVRSLAKHLYEDKSGRFVLVFDNVDQLDLEMQERVIRFAYAKMKEFHAFTVLSMWEETYFSSKQAGKTLSTMRTIPMQITRQSVASVLIRRLRYLLKRVRANDEPLLLLDEAVCDRATFCSFLELILESLLVKNRRVRAFLELVALGNIRHALETFSAFLTAGSLETRKIIRFMQQNEDYRVPVHEFIKCVMLGSKRYYAEATSNILNMFAVSDVERPSHFTRLRLLQCLYERRHEASAFGAGLIPIPVIQAYFSQIGVSEKDITVSIERLTTGGLIENDIRARRRTERAQAIRITGSGRYYLISLYRLFAYVDLAMQDTPIFGHDIFMSIADLCESTDMSDRMKRCEEFVAYLADQEEEEMTTIEKLDTDVTWRRRFVPNIRSSLDNTKRRLQERGNLP